MNNFVCTPLDDTLNITHLVTLHSFQYAPDFIFTGEKHDFWEMAYVKNGEVGVMAESIGYTLKRGEAIFHKPNEYHNIWAIGRVADVVILSFVCNDTAMEFFKGKLLSLNDRERILIDKILIAGKQTFSEPLNILFQTKLIKNTVLPFGCEQQLKNTLELLLISLIRNNAAINNMDRCSTLAKARNEELLTEAILRLLSENLYNSLTLDQVCSTICFSKTYLKRLFKKITGYSIMDYFLHLKLERAKILIDEKELSFSEISQKFNFSSIHYFSRIFKAKIGVTPTEYSKRTN